MNYLLTYPRAPMGTRGVLLSLAGALCALCSSAFCQSVAVIGNNDGKANETSQSTTDVFTQTLLSGYSGNHTIYWGALWGGSGPLGIPQVEPVCPTDFYSSTQYSASQWAAGSNVLGELHAQRLLLTQMESSLSQMGNTLAQISSLSSSEAESSGSFSSITVSGTTPWGVPWQGQTVPWTQWDSQNLAGCYQTELWIFGALLMLPIILKVKPA
jgi:hypothetical protein